MLSGGPQTVLGRQSFFCVRNFVSQSHLGGGLNSLGWYCSRLSRVKVNGYCCTQRFYLTWGTFSMTRRENIVCWESESFDRVKNCARTMIAPCWWSRLELRRFCVHISTLSSICTISARKNMIYAFRENGPPLTDTIRSTEWTFRARKWQFFSSVGWKEKEKKRKEEEERGGKRKRKERRKKGRKGWTRNDL